MGRSGTERSGRSSPRGTSGPEQQRGHPCPVGKVPHACTVCGPLWGSIRALEASGAVEVDVAIVIHINEVESPQGASRRLSSKVRAGHWVGQARRLARAAPRNREQDPRSALRHAAGQVRSDRVQRRHVSPRQFRRIRKDRRYRRHRGAAHRERRCCRP